jgi:thiol:disulfide interchange protein DsbC
LASANGVFPSEATVKYSVGSLAAGLLALSFALTAVAAESPAANPPLATVEANIRAGFAKSFPGVRIKRVGVTQWPGVYEAVTPEGIFYADATGHYAINGKLVDVQTQANLTQVREAELGRIDFGSLPLARAIKHVKGDGHRVMAVFADPDCPYCKKLETDLKAVDNVTVYTFIYPIEGLHPGATAHARQIWCAKDPANAWSAWVADRVEPQGSAADCPADPLGELSALGDRLEILGTPTIFLADGNRIPGYIPREDLERALDSTLPATARPN